MGEITTLFWDLGGVLLTNGWDTNSRRQAAKTFGLEWKDFQERHQLVSAQFERGELTLEEYLESTVFYESRNFSKRDFRDFMFSQSQPKKKTFEIIEELARCERYVMNTLNNESRELNLYRIKEFKLTNYFTAFFSSCFLGVKKPEKEIYQAALEITQKRPEECLYVDDRSLNLETAHRLGIRTIHFQNPGQLRESLKNLGITANMEERGK